MKDDGLYSELIKFMDKRYSRRIGHLYDPTIKERSIERRNSNEP